MANNKFGNFNNLELENSRHTRSLSGSYTVEKPISNLGILLGLTNTTNLSEIFPISMSQFPSANLGSTTDFDLLLPGGFNIRNFEFVVLIVVSDADDELSFRNLNRYDIIEVVQVHIENILI